MQEAEYELYDADWTSLVFGARLMALAAMTAVLGWAGEYEVDGRLSQTMDQGNRGNVHARPRSPCLSGIAVG